MTIDEAIEFCNEKSKNIKLRTEPKTFEQIAEWLEELKANRIALEKANGYLEANYRLGYNKAIDDYMNKLCNNCMQQTNECNKLECPFCTDGCDIVNIAEQLKAGNSNGS